MHPPFLLIFYSNTQTRAIKGYLKSSCRHAHFQLCMDFFITELCISIAIIHLFLFKKKIQAKLKSTNIFNCILVMLIQTKETRPKITNMRVVRNWRLVCVRW